MQVEGVVVCAFIRASEDLCKVSLRSKDPVAVNEIAAKFGGAGHRNAAGFAWECDVDEFLPQLRKAIQTELDLHK